MADHKQGDPELGFFKSGRPNLRLTGREVLQKDGGASGDHDENEWDNENIVVVEMNKMISLMNLIMVIKMHVMAVNEEDDYGV